MNSSHLSFYDQYIKSSVEQQLSFMGEKAWDNLKDSHLLLTGATGFLGTWLLNLLHEAEKAHGLNLNIQILSRNIERFFNRCPQFKNWPSLEALTGDVSTFDFSSCTPTHVILGATSSNDRNLNSTKVIDSMLKSVDNPLRRINSSNLRHLMFLSSGAVYSNQKSGDKPFQEECELSKTNHLPTTHYGKGKLVAEKHCLSWAKKNKIPCAIARGFTFSGAYLMPSSGYALTDFIEHVHRHHSCPKPKGQLDTLRSYLDGADAARHLWSLAISRSNGVYNIGSQNITSIFTLVSKVCNEMKVPFDLNRDMASNDTASQYLPNTKAFSTNHQSQQLVTLEQSINHTAKWIKYIG